MKRLLLAAAGLALVAGCGGPSAPAAQVGPVTDAPLPVLAEPASVRIPALRVTDDLIPVGVEALEDGSLLPVDSVGWYRLGYRPGEHGRAVLAGHVDWKGTPGAFQHLGELKPGDLVETSGADGQVITWTVYAVQEIPKAEYRARTVPLVFGPSAGRELALVTCSGRLVGHSYDSNTVVLARAL